MDERGTDVEIVLAPAHEQQCRRRVDDDPDACDEHDGEARDRLGGLQPAHGLPPQRSHGHQQQHRIGEGSQDAGALPAIGVPVVGTQASRQCATPGQPKPSDIAQVVPGIAQQRQRTDLPAVERLDGNKRQVQRDTEREGSVDVGGSVMVVRATHPTISTHMPTVARRRGELLNGSATASMLTRQPGRNAKRPDPESATAWAPIVGAPR